MFIDPEFGYEHNSKILQTANERNFKELEKLNEDSLTVANYFEELSAFQIFKEGFSKRDLLDAIIKGDHRCEEQSPISIIADALKSTFILLPINS